MFLFRNHTAPPSLLSPSSSSVDLGGSDVTGRVTAPAGGQRNYPKTRPKAGITNQMFKVILLKIFKPLF